MTAREIPGFIDAATLNQLERHGWAVVPRECVAPALRDRILGADQVQHLRRVTIADVVHAAADACGVEAPAVVGDSRRAELVEARHAAAWVAHHHFGFTPGCIGAALRREYSSIIYAIDAVEQALDPRRDGRDRTLALVCEVRERAAIRAGGPMRARLAEAG